MTSNENRPPAPKTEAGGDDIPWSSFRTDSLSDRPIARPNKENKGTRDSENKTGRIKVSSLEGPTVQLRLPAELTQTRGWVGRRYVPNPDPTDLPTLPTEI